MGGGIASRSAATMASSNCSASARGIFHGKPIVRERLEALVTALVTGINRSMFLRTSDGPSMEG